MAEESKRYTIDDFLDEVKEHRDDRGYLAHLKRGLATGTEDQAWSILAAQRFDFTDAVKRKIWAVVGGLSASLVNDGLLRTEGWDGMGTVLRHIMNAEGRPDENRTKNYETRLRRLLNCTDSAELCKMIVGVVQLAQSKVVPVNCRQLYFDLNGWDDPKKREAIRVRWASDFYRTEKDISSTDDFAKEGK